MEHSKSGKLWNDFPWLVSKH